MDRHPLTPTEFSSAVTAITSAFGDPTRREIYLFVHGTEVGATASEVAAHFDLHANVARHHLDKLVGGGHVGVATDPAGTAAGRPAKRYRTTHDDVVLDIPVRHDDILVTLLGRALALLGPEQAEAMAEEVGLEYGRSMAGAAGADSRRSFTSALHVVADALTAHGFAAHAEKYGGQLRIVSEHCPFGDAVVEHPVICAVDRGMVKGMLGSLYGEADADLQSSLPMGDDVCITDISG